MKLGRLVFPVAFALFVAGAIVAALFLRKMILEKAMLRAMEAGDGAMMRSLAGWWPAPVNVKDREGETPLGWAASNDDLALASALLDRGADVNAYAAGLSTFYFEEADRPAEVVSFERGTPLHVAITMSRLDAARLLVRRGADVNLATRKSTSWSSGGFSDSYRTFIPLELACWTGDAEFVDFLIRSGAKLPGKGAPFRWKMLLDEHRPQVWRLLLDRGADPDAKDADGFTAGGFAEHSGRAELLRLAREPVASLEAEFERMKPTLTEVELDTGEEACRWAMATAFKRGGETVMIEEDVGTSMRRLVWNFYYERGQLRLVVFRAWRLLDDDAEDLQEPRLESVTRYQFARGLLTRTDGGPPAVDTMPEDLLADASRLLKLSSTP